MKKKHITLLALVCMAANAAQPSDERTAPGNDQTQSIHTQQSHPVINPKDFTGMAQLTERIGTAARYGTIPTVYTLLALELHKHNKMVPVFACTSLALAPAAAGIGEWLLNYPQSRWDIYGEPTAHEETKREWLARKMRNAAAHIGNQGLKMGTVALPLGVAVEWYLFKETFESRNPLVRLFFTS